MKRINPYTFLLIYGVLAMTGFSCSPDHPNQSIDPDKVPDAALEPRPAQDGSEEASSATLVLAGGCFWCVEAVYTRLKGVSDVTSGYAGGTAQSANYKAVSTGMTDHAEVVQITYDPREVSFGQLLKVFFTVAHDPTQLNRQGADVGRQYRSAIFYQREEEKQAAEAYIRQLEEAGIFNQPIVTTLEPLETFFVAEAYHQDYAQLNPDHPYIRATSLPKVRKLEVTYPEKIRPQDRGTP